MHTWIHIYIYIHITCIPALWNTYIYTYISHAFQLYEIHVYIYIYIHTYHMHSSSMKYIYIYVYIYISSHPQKSCQTFRLLFSCCGRPTRPSPTRVTFLIFAQQLLAETSPVFFWWISCEFMTTHWFQVCLGAIFEALFQIAPNRSKPLVIYDLLSLIWIKSKNMAIWPEEIGVKTNLITAMGHMGDGSCHPWRGLGWVDWKNERNSTIESVDVQSTVQKSSNSAGLCNVSMCWPRILLLFWHFWLILPEVFGDTIELLLLWINVACFD